MLRFGSVLSIFRYKLSVVDTWHRAVTNINCIQKTVINRKINNKRQNNHTILLKHTD